VFTEHFFDAAQRALAAIDPNAVEAMAEALAKVRDREGRLFLIGVGGSAGHASHATNDFRKICGFEAYCPTDNVSELTARINDEGWEGSFSAWLEGSRLRAADGLLIFSVGGGSVSPPVSANIVRAIQLAKARGATVTGIVGRSGGYTAEAADACVVIPTVDAELITPLVEGLAAVVWHGLVSHPKLAMNKGHWEQLAAGTKTAPGDPAASVAAE
jgi:D-sedoheptulose 7-phosphate isomerase